MLDVFFAKSYELNDKIAKPFEPLAHVVYKPVDLVKDQLGVGHLVALIVVMHQLSFWLSLGLSHITNPRLRMIYNCVAGLILGFYFHGVSYLFVIFQWASVYPLMAYLPRDSSWKPVMAITVICMTIRNMFVSLENETIEFRVQATCIFMRQWMICCHLLDSTRLDD